VIKEGFSGAGARKRNLDGRSFPGHLGGTKGFIFELDWRQYVEEGMERSLLTAPFHAPVFASERDLAARVRSRERGMRGRRCYVSMGTAKANDDGKTQIKTTLRWRQ